MRPTEKPRDGETCRWEVSSKGKKPKRLSNLVEKGPGSHQEAFARIPPRLSLQSHHFPAQNSMLRKTLQLKPILTSLQLKTHAKAASVSSDNSTENRIVVEKAVDICSSRGFSDQESFPVLCTEQCALFPLEGGISLRRDSCRVFC